MKINSAYKFSRTKSMPLTFNNIARCLVWKIFWIFPFWVSWTLIALLKNHVLKIFLALFHFLQMKNKPQSSKYILSEINNFKNLFSSLDLFFIVFLLFLILYFNFFILNLMIILYLFLKQQHASKSLGGT